MKSLFIRHKIVIGFAVVVLLAVLCTPIVLELRAISKTKDNFLFDSAVFNEASERAVNKHSVDEFLNPSFMKKYNLNLDDYLDAKGYFSPDGTHWKAWSIETKVAAILMWQEKEVPTVFEIRRIIYKVGSYFETNDVKTPVVEVVNAAVKQ